VLISKKSFKPVVNLENQKSEIRNQKSEIRSQKSEIRIVNYTLHSALYTLNSTLCTLRSTLYTLYLWNKLNFHLTASEFPKKYSIFADSKIP